MARLLQVSLNACSLRPDRRMLSTAMPRCQAVIIGAGTEGPAAAAYLCSAHVETQVFGEAMAVWRHQVPEGMFLRSSWEASHIADPHRALTLDTYQTESSTHLSTPVPLVDFIQYG